MNSRKALRRLIEICYEYFDLLVQIKIKEIEELREEVYKCFYVITKQFR